LFAAPAAAQAALLEQPEGDLVPRVGKTGLTLVRYSAGRWVPVSDIYTEGLEAAGAPDLFAQMERLHQGAGKGLFLFMSTETIREHIRVQWHLRAHFGRPVIGYFEGWNRKREFVCAFRGVPILVAE
jgi:hypothetical protein